MAIFIFIKRHDYVSGPSFVICRAESEWVGWMLIYHDSQILITLRNRDLTYACRGVWMKEMARHTEELRVFKLAT